MAQAKVVRRARRAGALRRLVRGWARMEVDSWKMEFARIKALIKQTKEACWQRFCEEAGDKNP